MNYTIHENGWTVIVHDKIETLSNDDAIEVGRLAAENMVVVFKNQTLTPEQQEQFCSKIGDCQKLYDVSKPLKGQRAEHIAVTECVSRVTGKKTTAGESMGFAGHNETLDWHADQPSKKDRYPLLWLYAAKGSAGSRTSWINLIEVYNSLPYTLKNKIAYKKVVCGYKDNVYTYNPFFKEHVARDFPVSLVTTNAAGKTGLFFPFLQMFEMQDTSQGEFDEIVNELKSYVLQERFVYHHNWQDGDVVISEQWLSIHKRWAFDKMQERVMHRIAFNHKKVY